MPIEGGIRKLALIAALLLLTGCPSSTPPAPPVAPPLNVPVSMIAANWDLLYGSGTATHPVAIRTGMYFDFVPLPGSIHYFDVPYSGMATTSQTLTATFEVIATNAIYAADVETVESGPASLHLFIEHSGDAAGTNQYYRWWCGAGEYTLGNKDNQVVTVSCPLVSTSWTSVYGLTDPTDFAATLANMGNVGLTFGGNGVGWGHGVRLVSGTSRFELLGYTIQ